LSGSRLSFCAANPSAKYLLNLEGTSKVAVTHIFLSFSVLFAGVILSGTGAFKKDIWCDIKPGYLDFYVGVVGNL
jgi:hypothetical protein